MSLNYGDYLLKTLITTLLMLLVCATAFAQPVGPRQPRPGLTTHFYDIAGNDPLFLLPGLDYSVEMDTNHNFGIGLGIKATYIVYISGLGEVSMPIDTSDWYTKADGSIGANITIPIVPLGEWDYAKVEVEWIWYDISDAPYMHSTKGWRFQKL